MTIDCLGNTGGVLVSGTNGIIVNAAATDIVTIRNMAINGLNTGLNAINVLGALSVSVEQVRIFGFTQAGINIATTSPNARLIVTNSTISDGTTATGNGIAITSNVGGFQANITNSRIIKMTGDCVVMNATGKVVIRGSELDGCAIGVEQKIAGANVLLDSSIISHNGTGLKGFGGAVADITNNTFSYNTFGLSVNGGTIQTHTHQGRSIGHTPLFC